MWKDVHQKGKLRARIDTERALIQLRDRGETILIDLTEYGLFPYQFAPVGGDDTVTQGRCNHAPVPVIKSQNVTPPTERA